MNQKKPVVILVGQTPPPHTGQAIIIKILLDGLQEYFHVEHVRMAYSESVSAVGKITFSKVGELFRLICQTRRLLKKYPDAIFYYPPASPQLVPLLRDIIFLFFVRPLSGLLVYHYHAYGLPEFVTARRYLSKISKVSYGVADLAVVPTPSCQTFEARHVEVVPSGMDVPKAFTEAEGEEHQAFRVLFVGIHTEEKGIYDLIETVHHLVQKEIPIEVHCVGVWRDQTERDRAEALVFDYELQDVITFCGCCLGDDLWREYAWADVLFFPTHYSLETQGMVVVEAMAFSLPVVASRWHGPRDVVEDGQTGVLCEPGNIEAYANALSTLFVDFGQRKEMGRAGRMRYEALYTRKRFVESWVDLITQMSEKTGVIKNG